MLFQEDSTPEFSTAYTALKLIPKMHCTQLLGALEGDFPPDAYLDTKKELTRAVCVKTRTPVRAWTGVHIEIARESLHGWRSSSRTGSVASFHHYLGNPTHLVQKQEGEIWVDDWHVDLDPEYQKRHDDRVRRRIADNDFNDGIDFNDSNGGNDANGGNGGNGDNDLEGWDKHPWDDEPQYDLEGNRLDEGPPANTQVPSELEWSEDWSNDDTLDPSDDTHDEDAGAQIEYDPEHIRNFEYEESEPTDNIEETDDSDITYDVDLPWDRDDASRDMDWTEEEGEGDDSFHEDPPYESDEFTQHSPSEDVWDGDEHIFSENVSF